MAAPDSSPHPEPNPEPEPNPDTGEREDPGGHRFTDAGYPAAPYPGRSPECSYVHLDGVGRRLRPDHGTLSGWRLEPGERGEDPDGRLEPGERGEDLDGWLERHGAAPLSGRVPVLAYGSNRCPEKITWLRGRLGLAGPVVVLDARTEGLAAVWAAGRRAHDGQRPATLAAAPGASERHAVWLATPEQVAVLDRCEGRGERYRLARLRTGTVRTPDGAVLAGPWCYVAHGEARRPLLAGGRTAGRTAGRMAGQTAGQLAGQTAGRMVRCAELGQSGAAALDGVPADADGLDVEEVAGAPRPDEWPAALFAYGLLQPGQVGWRLVAPHAGGGAPVPAAVPGAVYDTGEGWPAMLPATDRTVAGTLIPLADPVSALPVLDGYEGPDYRRVRVVVPGTGTPAWAYIWVGPRDRLLDRPWRPR
jgi:gamma-glutamylcyclotransferase (GGCT)/AIG2-like uncharacterized protein YtfP